MTPSGRLPRILTGLLAMGPPLLALLLVHEHGVDMPHVDDWRLSGVIPAVREGEVSLLSLWLRHNEHRILFGRVAMIGLALASDWNLVWQMFASLGLTGVMVWLVLPVVRGLTPLTRGVGTLLISAFAYSLHGWNNWLWGWQLTLVLAVVAVVASLRLLALGETRRGRVRMAAVCATIGSYSFLSGFLVWPVGLLVLLLRKGPDPKRRRAATMTWLRWAGAVIGLHFASVLVLEGGLRDDLGPPKGPWTSAQLGSFLLRWVGAALLGEHGEDEALVIVGAAGLVLSLVVAAILGWRARGDRLAPREALLFALGAFGLGCGAVIAIGRVPLNGLLHATASRYAAFSGLAWIAALVGLLVVLDGHRAGRQVARLAGALALAALAATWSGSWDAGRVHGDRLRQARDVLRRGEGITLLEIDWAFGHPVESLPTAGEEVARLRRHRLSFFRAEVSSGEPPVMAPLEGRLDAPGDPAGPRAAGVIVIGGTPGNAAALILSVGERLLAASLGRFDDRGQATFSATLPAGVDPAEVKVSGYGVDRWTRLQTTPDALDLVATWRSYVTRAR